LLVIPHPVCYEWSRAILFKERLLKCEPSDLGRFVVDLRERHLDYWRSYPDMHPRERNSNRSTYHQWCALPSKRALVTHSPYTFPRNVLLDLPRDVIRSVAHFILRAHALRIGTVTWTYSTSPTCDLCNANDVQDEQHVVFHHTHPRAVSLSRIYATMFHPAGF